jgi:hypothetical protein
MKQVVTCFLGCSLAPLMMGIACAKADGAVTVIGSQ